MKNQAKLMIMGLFFLSTLTGCERIALLKEARENSKKFSNANQQDTTAERITEKADSQGRDPDLLSAFYGLDSALPIEANNAICRDAGGKDGMPVIFSHEIKLETMQAGDFTVVTQAGVEGEITCVTIAPADDYGEARTLLLVGEYGSIDDQPRTVEVTGNLLSIDGKLNFKGSKVQATSLEEGPRIVWAEVVPPEQWDLGKFASKIPFGGGSGCPVNTKQVVRVVWAGGVTKPGGDEIDGKERDAYRVTLNIKGDIADDATLDSVVVKESTVDKAVGVVATEVVPFAIGDLGDGDNNHKLCLDVIGTPVEVSFPAGLVTDPREDLNPATTVKVQS